MDRSLFLSPLCAPAENEGLVSSRSGAEFHLQSLAHDGPSLPHDLCFEPTQLAPRRAHDVPAPLTAQELQVVFGDHPAVHHPDPVRHSIARLDQRNEVRAAQTAFGDRIEKRVSDGMRQHVAAGLVLQRIRPPLHADLARHRIRDDVANASDLDIEGVKRVQVRALLRRREEARGVWVSGNFYELLGVAPLLGRRIASSDEQMSRAGGPGGVAASRSGLTYAMSIRPFSRSAVASTTAFAARTWAVVGSSQSRLRQSQCT